MTNEENNLLQRIAQRLDDHVDRYDRDRSEIKERVAADKAEQTTFREGILAKVEGLEQQIAPVVNDHRIAARILKWSGAGGTVAFMAWLWQHLKDSLRG